MTQTGNAPTGPKTSRRYRFWPRTWRGWVAATLATLFLLLCISWALTRVTPPWYQPLDPSADTVIDDADRTQRLLLDLHNVVERVPLGEQTWTITQDQVNSLLAIRFAPPLNPDGSHAPASTQKPNLISDPYVVFTPGKITLCARTSKLASNHPQGGVGSATFSVGIINTNPPQGLVKLTNVWAGNLPIPRSLVEPRIRALLPVLVPIVTDAILPLLDARDPTRTIPQQDLEQVLTALTQGQPFPLQHTVKRKQFIIKELRVDEGSFTIVLIPPTPAAVRPRTAP